MVPPSGNKGDCQFEPGDDSLSDRSVCAQQNGKYYKLNDYTDCMKYILNLYWATCS